MKRNYERMSELVNKIKRVLPETEENQKESWEFDYPFSYLEVKNEMPESVKYEIVYALDEYIYELKKQADILADELAKEARRVMNYICSFDNSDDIDEIELFDQKSEKCIELLNLTQIKEFDFIELFKWIEKSSQITFFCSFKRLFSLCSETFDLYRSYSVANAFFNIKNDIM